MYVRVDWLIEYGLSSMEPSKDYRTLHRLRAGGEEGAGVR